MASAAPPTQADSRRVRQKGHAIAIRSDWPSSYGVLGDSNKGYGAHLLAVDDSAGAYSPIPEKALRAYRRNADMWDCAAAMLVPFAEPRPPDPISVITNTIRWKCSIRHLPEASPLLSRRSIDPNSSKSTGRSIAPRGKTSSPISGHKQNGEGGTLLRKADTAKRLSAA